MRTASLILVASLVVVACGHSFTAQREARIDIAPLAPSSAVLKADGEEVCRLSHPTGDLPIEVSCPEGEILWADAAGRGVRCAAFACPPGKAPDYSTPGRVECR